MKRLAATLGLTLMLVTATQAKPRAPVELPVLIAADEVPAMEILAAQLSERVHARATIVNVKKDKEPLPADLTSFRAVLVC